MKTKPIPYDDLEDCNVYYESGEEDKDEEDDDDNALKNSHAVWFMFSSYSPNH